jgi:hypothetical protein
MNPLDFSVLWARVLVCLEKRKVMPTGIATPGEIANHADKLLGHRAVSHFVYDYYYPALYDHKPIPPAALSWVEQFEKSS